MLDYDDISALQKIIDGSLSGAAGVEVLTGHVGTAAISTFFANLSADGIGSGANQNLDCAPQYQYFGAPAVPPGRGCAGGSEYHQLQIPPTIP